MTSLLIKTLEKPFEEMTDISEEQQRLIIGGDCVYKGTTYGTNSTEKMPKLENGVIVETVKTCGADGTWK